MSTLAILGAVISVLGLGFTIVASSVGVAVWVSGHLTEIKTDVKHIFKRIERVEDDVDDLKNDEGRRPGKKTRR